MSPRIKPPNPRGRQTAKPWELDKQIHGPYSGHLDHAFISRSGPEDKEEAGAANVSVWQKYPFLETSWSSLFIYLLMSRSPQPFPRLPGAVGKPATSPQVSPLDGPTPRGPDGCKSRSGWSGAEGERADILNCLSYSGQVTLLP